MRVERWIPINDGEWNESALRAKLGRAEYADLTPYAFPAGSFLPPHAHLEDHAEAVLEGEMRVRAGSWEAVLKPGDVVHVPRETEHSVEALGRGPLRILDGSRAHRPARHFGARLVLLALLLVLLNAWSARHLGIRLQDFLLVNAVVVLVPQLLRFLDPLEEKSVHGFLRGAFRYLASTPALVLLALGVAGTGFFSTVRVVPAAPYPETTVTVMADDSAVPWLEPGSRPVKLKDQPVTVVKRVFPSGRMVHLSAKDYVDPEPVDLVPWFVTTVELEPLPSIVLRLPKASIGIGEMVIGRMAAEKFQPIVTIPSNGRELAAVVLGRAPTSSEAWGADAAGDDGLLELWKAYFEWSVDPQLLREERLRARFYPSGAKEGHFSAEGEFSTRGDDVLLRHVS